MLENSAKDAISGSTTDLSDKQIKDFFFSSITTLQADKSSGDSQSAAQWENAKQDEYLDSTPPSIEIYGLPKRISLVGITVFKTPKRGTMENKRTLQVPQTFIQLCLNCAFALH